MDVTLPLLALAAVVASVSLLVRTGVSAWLRMKDMERARRLPDADTLQMIIALREQLDRIERAVDVQSVELERVAEHQRFTARLLAEQSDAAHDNLPAAPPTEGKRPITPH